MASASVPQHKQNILLSVSDLPSNLSSRRAFFDSTPLAPTGASSSTAALSAISDPILLEKAVQKLAFTNPTGRGYVHSSFEKVHEDTQALLGLIQQTREGRNGKKYRAGLLPSDRDLAGLASTAQGLANKLQAIRNYRHKTRRVSNRSSSDKTSRSSSSSSHSPCDDCNRTQTPEWRAGPTGPEALCNVCGLLYAKRMLRMRALSK